MQSGKGHNGNSSRHAQFHMNILCVLYYCVVGVVVFGGITSYGMPRVEIKHISD